MKVIGLSGAHGSGKTTLLNALKDRGWKVDDFKVSRAVQAKLGWDRLDHVMESLETMMEFQDEVFRQKYRHDHDLHWASVNEDDSTIILTERTFADVDAYTTRWAWRFVDQGKMTEAHAFKFLMHYHSRCVKAQLNSYAGTILLPLMSHMPVEEDPNRAARNDAEAIYEHAQRFLEGPDFLRHRKLIITTKSIEDRATQVECFLQAIRAEEASD